MLFCFCCSSEKKKKIGNLWSIHMHVNFHKNHSTFVQILVQCFSFPHLIHVEKKTENQSFPSELILQTNTHCLFTNPCKINTVILHINFYANHLWVGFIFLLVLFVCLFSVWLKLRCKTRGIQETTEICSIESQTIPQISLCMNQISPSQA